MNYSKIAVFVGLLVLSALISAGCGNSNSPLSSGGTGTQANVSKDELKQIQAAIGLDATSVAPNSVGFMTFYGDVTNSSNRYVKKVHILAQSIVTDKGKIIPSGMLGKDIVKDLSPGQTKNFEITTSVPEADLGKYEVTVEKVEL